jgi:conjugative relaxase-like TrwC/TraI family protein
MMTVTKLENHGGVGDLIAYLQATEYFLDSKGQSRSTSEWVGKGSADLGLVGEPDADAMARLAAGFSPTGKRVALTPNAGEADRAIGTDITFSSPKSVSIAFAIASPEDKDDILAAQNHAVKCVLDFIEKEGLVRAKRGSNSKKDGPGIDSIRTEGLIASSHLHLSSRALDMQLHNHVLIMNLARGSDGKTSCVENYELKRYQQALGALYRTELAAGMQKLGYGIEHTIGVDGLGEETGHDAFEIVGISKELRDHFSKRTADVKAYEEEHPHSHLAALATREDKEEPPCSELIAGWTKQLAEFEALHPGHVPTIEKLRSLKSVSHERPVVEVMDKVHEFEAVIDRPKLLERLARNSVGKGIAHVVAEEQAFAKRPDFVQIEPVRQTGPKKTWSRRPDLCHRETRYASKKGVVELEKQVLSIADTASKDMRHQVPAGTVADVIKAFEARKSAEHGAPFKLKGEQRRMVEHCCTDTGAIALVQGRAGTGKTVAASAVCEVFKAQGYKVRGAAVAWTAANTLAQETGIESTALAALASGIKHKNPKFMPDARSVLLIDEASFLGTRDFAFVQKAYSDAGGKIILQGDSHQLQAVSAGGVLRSLTERLGFAELKEITRQKTADGLALAEMTYGKSEQKRGTRTRRETVDLGRAIVGQLDAMGAVNRFENTKEARDGVIDAWLASAVPATEKLAIAGTNLDSIEISQGIRAGLKARGELGATDYMAYTKTAKSGEQRLPVTVGDRLRFKAKVPDKADNAETCTIEGIKPNRNGGLDISVLMDAKAKDGKARRFTFDTLQDSNFVYGYSSTTYSSQGATVSEAFWLGTPASDQHNAVVAATRARVKFQVFIDTETEAGFTSSLGRHGLKANALEEGIKHVNSWASSLADRFATIRTATTAAVGRLLGSEHAPAPDHIQIQNQKLKNQQRGMTR